MLWLSLSECHLRHFATKARRKESQRIWDGQNNAQEDVCARENSGALAMLSTPGS